MVVGDEGLGGLLLRGCVVDVFIIKMVTEGIEPSTVALLAQRSNQLSYATYLSSLSIADSSI